jgi:hypothetical protein
VLADICHAHRLRRFSLRTKRKVNTQWLLYAGGSNGYRAPLARHQLTPGLISSLPGTAGLPPFISISTSYPELPPMPSGTSPICFSGRARMRHCALDMERHHAREVRDATRRAREVRRDREGAFQTSTWCGTSCLIQQGRSSANQITSRCSPRSFFPATPMQTQGIPARR